MHTSDPTHHPICRKGNIGITIYSQVESGTLQGD